jgi:2-phosphoglycerate kinase
MEKYPERVNVRVFFQVCAVWDSVFWDGGVLARFARDPGSCREPWAHLSADCELFRQCREYFDAIWQGESIDLASYSVLRDVFPSAAAFREVMSAASQLCRLYGKTPSRRNAFFVLIGGGAGTGKSTLAWQLATRLGVRNVVSTDMVREVLRQQPSAPPVVSAETWEAWKEVKGVRAKDLFRGIATQSAFVLSAMDQMIGWCLDKGMPTIIEGIHIVPGEWLEQITKRGRVLAFFVDASDKQLEENFHARCRSTHMRGSQERLVRSGDRLELHKEIIRRAAQAGFPVLRTDSWEELVRAAMDITLSGLLGDTDERL